MSDQPTNGKTVGDLAQEILNRIITDADFRQQIAKNPEETLAEAGYTAGDDVSGYVLSLGVRPLGSGNTQDTGKALRVPSPLGPGHTDRTPALRKAPTIESERNPKNLKVTRSQDNTGRPHTAQAH